MMGRTHALTGWCAGLAAAAILGYDELGEAVLIAATTSGYALLPDLDHPNARASRLLGVVTRVLSRVVRRWSAAMYALTKGPRDDAGRAGTHRHLTHTVAFALFMGLVTAGVTAVGGPWAVAAVIILGLLLAESALGDWLLAVTVAFTTVWIATADDPVLLLDSVTGWLGIAVALGCLVHCLGDAVTVSGCPLLWPLPIAGRTWYEIGPPKRMRFRTGAGVETYVVDPLCTLLAVALIPGVPDVATRLFQQVMDLIAT